MFSHIQTISDVQPFVADKKEIRFSVQPNGVTVGCYMFMDSHTFDTPQAAECRGIAFDAQGRIISRPLHKFFNMGEKAHLTAQAISERGDIVAVFEKLDGSMIATAQVDGELAWRSKKSFSSAVVQLTERFVKQPENRLIQDFAQEVVDQGWTAVFELTHPEARIVVSQSKPQLRLLHVRDNVTGQYLMLEPEHPIHRMIQTYAVPVAPRFEMSFEKVLASLEDMQNMEGYVVQFRDGDMVKIKCPWYTRLHRSVTFLRERDIATLALNEELDDVKSSLVEIGIALEDVEAVEARLKARLLGIQEEIDAAYQADHELSRKDFALKWQKNPYFGLMMQRYQGKEVALAEWYAKARLKEDFSLRVLGDEAFAEALEG